MLADNFYPPVHRWESKEVEIPQNTQNPFSMSSSLTSATFIFLPSSFCSRGEEGLYGLITFLGRNIRCARGKPRGFIYSQRRGRAWRNPSWREVTGPPPGWWGNKAGTLFLPAFSAVSDKSTTSFIWKVLTGNHFTWALCFSWISLPL